MLLILTNTEDATADYLAAVLKDAGVRFQRFDTDTLLASATLTYHVGLPSLRFGATCFRPDDITNVWYRRPERLKHKDFGQSPEGNFTLDEWSEGLEGFFAHIPKDRWVNHPSHNAMASHKLEQLTTAHELGFLVPDTLVTQDAGELRTFAARHSGRLIAKPMARGYVERPENDRDTLIYTNEVSSGHLRDLDDLAACPTLFQQFIEKRCDVRITVVDGEIHAVAMTARGRSDVEQCDIRRNNMQDVDYSRLELPDEISSLVLALVDRYRLRFAAIDMAVSSTGEWYFFEVNPNGQWAWLDLAGTTRIGDSFVKSFRDR